MPLPFADYPGMGVLFLFLRLSNEEKFAILSFLILDRTGNETTRHSRQNPQWPPFEYRHVWLRNDWRNTPNYEEIGQPVPHLFLRVLCSAYSGWIGTMDHIKVEDWGTEECCDWKGEWSLLGNCSPKYLGRVGHTARWDYQVLARASGGSHGKNVQGFFQLSGSSQCTQTKSLTCVHVYMTTCVIV